MTGHDEEVSPPAPLRARAGPISGSSAAPGGFAGGHGGRSMKWGKEPALAGGSSAATMGSPPAPLRARARPISGSSAAPGASAGGHGARSMKWGKEPALAGGSSAATMVSPPPPSKSQKGREAEAQGGKKKSKKAVLDALGVAQCSLCGRSFKSQKAVYGHMRVHKTAQKQQAEELASILLDLGQRKLDTMEGRETKGDGSALHAAGAGSALAAAGASSSAVEAQRKKIHMALDLNEECPQEDDNDDEDYLGDNEVA